MSQKISKRTDESSYVLPANRRKFLQAAGFAGLAGLTSALSAGTAAGWAAAPSTTPDTPGAVSNRSEYIESPGVYAENQEPPRVHTSIPFDSVSSARDANVPFTELESRLNNSPYFHSLDGEWDFTWHKNPTAVPDSYADTDWDSITVPRCWQTQGYDTDVYLDTQLTWEGIDDATNTTPPEVPYDYNPVGTYRRTFSVPADWDGRESFLNFEGVKQAFFLWVDDQYVGYNQGSMTAAEFDVTNYISAGSEHTLTVQVYRFSDGEALETQDMFRWSGIYRSVYLYSTPDVHLRDFFVRTNLDDEYRDAELRVEAQLANYTDTPQGTHTIRGHLFDSDGSKLKTLEMSGTVDQSDGETLSGSTTVTDPEKWTAETPTLYTIVLEHTSGGTTIETMFDSVGFREYSIVDQQFRVNGQPVYVRGVNSHEHDPTHGRTVPIDTVKEDFELMKQYNVNTLRCSHYPRDPSLYYLADEYGLYLCDEVNVETHWNRELLGQNDKWDAQAIERFRRMVQSDKNRPCIFMWSTGNESGLHDAHFDMAEYVTGEDEDGDGDAGAGIDSTRLLYHQSYSGKAPYADIIGPRYISPPDLADRADSDNDRPVVIGEYAHAMGNSGGLFHDFWEIIQPDTEAAGSSQDGELETHDEYDRFQGGFVWDWVDQDVYRTMEVDGEETQYRFYDANPFCMNGVIFEDRTIQPGLEQLKHSHQPIGATATDSMLSSGTVRITNHDAFRNVDYYDSSWELAEDGSVIQSGGLSAEIEPLDNSTVEIPWDQNPLSLKPGREYHLRLRFDLPEATEWAQAGHEVAFVEFEVPFDVPAPERTSVEDLPTLSVTENGNGVTISGDEFEYEFEESAGTITSVTSDETTVLEKGPQLDFFRAPIQNEIQSWGTAEADEWFSLHLDSLQHETRSMETTRIGDSVALVTIDASVRGAGTDAGYDVRYRYYVLGSGDIVLKVDAEPTDTLVADISNWIPRMGVAMDVPAEFNSLEWFGRGPEETYPDRKWSGETSIHSGSVTDQYVAYQPPSDNGNKTDVRWASLTDGNGTGLAAFGQPTTNLNIDQYSNLTQADHNVELREKDGVYTVHLDDAVTGLGGTPIQALEKYQVQPEPTSFQVTLRPYATNDDDPRELNRQQIDLSAVTSTTEVDPAQ